MTKKLFRRVLLVNDDGFYAPGIRLLEQVAEALADEVWIVAPATDKSGVSNSVSLREPVRIEPQGDRRYAIHGTPADCVTIAVRHLMKESLPDLVLSGINSGSNIGFETTLSGTVGAAITGVLLGIPSIALSQDKLQDAVPNWTCAETFCLPVLQMLTKAGLPRGCCLSVNFPDLPVNQVKGMKVTQQGIGKVKGMNVAPTVDPLGDTYYWIRVEHGITDLPEHSEVLAINEGYISVTPLTFERTEQDVRRQLAERISSHII